MTAKKPLTGKRIALYFVLFFATFATVDAYFVYTATTTHRGLVTDNAYEKGLDYNATIQAAEAQDNLGWHISSELEGSILTVRALGADKLPLDGAIVAVYFTRVVQSGYDFSVPVLYAGDGVYKRSIDFPLAGQWDATLVVTWNDRQYQTTTRILAP